jgi:hypothetical protein
MTRTEGSFDSTRALLTPLAGKKCDQGTTARNLPNHDTCLGTRRTSNSQHILYEDSSQDSMETDEYSGKIIAGLAVEEVC